MGVVSWDGLPIETVQEAGGSLAEAQEIFSGEVDRAASPVGLPL